MGPSRRESCSACLRARDRSRKPSRSPRTVRCGSPFTAKTVRCRSMLAPCRRRSSDRPRFRQPGTALGYRGVGGASIRPFAPVVADDDGVLGIDAATPHSSAGPGRQSLVLVPEQHRRPLLGRSALVRDGADTIGSDRLRPIRRLTLGLVLLLVACSQGAGTSAPATPPPMTPKAVAGPGEVVITLFHETHMHGSLLGQDYEGHPADGRTFANYVRVLDQQRRQL